MINMATSNLLLVFIPKNCPEYNNNRISKNKKCGGKSVSAKFDDSLN